MRFICRAAALSAALTLVAVAGSAPAHEGHDQGGAPAEIAAAAAPRASSASPTFEVVVVARKGALSVYVDRFATNEPVIGATLQAQTPAGDESPSPQPDGSYRLLAPWSEKPGDHALVLTVTALDGSSDVFPIDLHIPEPAATRPAAGKGLFGLITPAAAEGAAAGLRSADGAVVAAAGGGFVAGLLAMGLIRWRRTPPATAALVAAAALLLSVPAPADEGHDHGGPRAPAAASGARDQAQRMPEGSVFVPKPTQRLLGLRTVVVAAERHRRAIELSGRIVPDPNGSGLVQAALGGRLSAPPDGFPLLGTRVKAGDVLAYVTPPVATVDVSDMRQRQSELDQQIAIVERRLARLEPLSRSGAVATFQLEETRLELEGLRDRRTALDRVRREPEALVAPVEGLVAEANVAAGMMAQPSQVVFQIIDPARLWIQALSFESIGAPERATARLGSGRTLDLVFQGAGLADRNQAVPVQFRIAGDTGGLRVGQFVTVFAGAGEARDGLAVPRASVVRASTGQVLLYEHTAPERFEPREVRIEPLDGERVLVAAGMPPGRRIVTTGAELLAQVR